MSLSYWEPLATGFEKNADAGIAAGARAYMRNQWDYYGIPSPLRRQLLGEFIRQYGLPKPEQLEDLIRYAWDQPQREWQYAGMELFEKLIRHAEPGMLPLTEWMICNKSWWDTVDFIAPNLTGTLFRKFPETRMPLLEDWMASGHLWLMRSCLIHQLRYKKETDADLLFQLCERLAGHPDFFIRKAIGWALRQHSKAEPEAVIHFVETHSMSPLSRKEALKVINRGKM
jgi:3-methyladenine DNA glycosylase AlkD